jgi:hypothetical protein
MTVSQWSQGILMQRGKTEFALAQMGGCRRHDLGGPERNRWPENINNLRAQRLSFGARHAGSVATNLCGLYSLWVKVKQHGAAKRAGAHRRQRHRYSKRHAGYFFQACFMHPEASRIGYAALAPVHRQQTPRDKKVKRRIFSATLWSRNSNNTAGSWKWRQPGEGRTPRHEPAMLGARSQLVVSGGMAFSESLERACAKACSATSGTSCACAQVGEEGAQRGLNAHAHASQ